MYSPNSKCEQVWSQQWGHEDKENIRGEDPPLHHLCLPNTEALLLRVLKHKLSAEKEETNQKQSDAAEQNIEKKQKNKQT